MKLHKFIVLLLLLLAIHSTSPTFSAFRTIASLFGVTRTLIREGTKFQNSQIPDAKTILPEYDYIIIGGGSAGCVVANRLSENPYVSVLLLEAGRDENIIMDIPLFATYFQIGDTNWKYRTQPQRSACLGLKNGRCNWPRGKVLGGSSVLNSMVYTRGNIKDYDRWRDLGNPGWGYSDVLPYFIKMEDYMDPEFRDSPLRGTGGPLQVAYPPYHTKLAQSFVDAGREFGFNVLDYNAEQQVGFQFVQATQRNGTRLSSNRAYIMPIKHRRNLHVKKEAMVTKILINPINKQAYGVVFITNGKRIKVKARHEVILSAGAIGTPQLLMLSGIGPAEHLHSLGIPVIQDLKVGYNLQDHIGTGGLTFLVNQKLSLMMLRLLYDASNTFGEYSKFHRGPLTVPGGLEALGFINTRLNNETYDYPDVELLFVGGSLTSDPALTANFGIKEEIYQSYCKPIEHDDAFIIFPMLLRPKSSGRILLNPKNPSGHPLIYHNYLTQGNDIDVLVEATKAAIELTRARVFRQYGTRLYDNPLPACRHIYFGSDEYWRCAIRQLTFTIYHQCGTAKMGPPYDPDAVVDPELRVYGIKGLRVIDASIMPSVPSGHTNAPVIMIAERASDFIKSSWYSYYKK